MPRGTTSPRSERSSLCENTDGLFGQYFLTDVPKLESIFFAEFDNKTGPVIRHQYPIEVVSESDFPSFSPAIIPKNELLNRLVKINIGDYKVMGHAVGMEHETYQRHRQLFNMCFVVKKESTVDSMYEPLVQKCAEYLVELEQECKLISDLDQRNRIFTMMKTIFDELNKTGECVMPVTGQTTLYLKLCPAYRGVEPPKVSLFMVPIFTRQVKLSNELVEKMDVLSQKIIRYIDGVRCVKEIATEAEIDPDLVCRCIRNLHFYECISMVPLFLYDNSYVATEKLNDFYNNESAKHECLQFVNIDKSRPVVFSDVFRLYMSLKCGPSLREWIEENEPHRYNVDERRFIQFGMHKRFLRKLSIYPVVINRSDRDEQPSRTNIFDRCDGTNAIEDLAVLFGMLPKELHKLLSDSKKFEFIAK